MTTEITCIADLLDALQGTSGPSLRWFRGHSDASWGLAPSVSRNRGWLEDEDTMIRRFVQESASRVRDRPRATWEWICLAQHHGVPTRLLDWTENPLIGLYFAVERDIVDGRAVDGRLWALDPLTLNSRHYVGPRGVLMFDHDEILKAYLPGRESPGPPLGSLAALAPKSFDRVLAQSGVFTVCHSSDMRPLSNVVPDALDGWRVPLPSKERIRYELGLFNITAATVYPDLSHIGDQISRQHES